MEKLADQIEAEDAAEEGVETEGAEEDQAAV